MLSCPLCRLPLESNPTHVRCANNHSFDRAKQGYLNLLPVQHKASRAPGDNAEMVTARRAFLNGEHYAPIAVQLATIAQQLNPSTWLDIGCGEGFYTHHIAQALPNSTGYGIDVSKDAIRHSCQRSKQIHWLVASMANLPLADQSCDLITSIFSPITWPEALRVMHSGSTLVRLGPASDHLIELREMLYDEVHPYDDSKHLKDAPHALHLESTQLIRYTLSLNDPADRHNLLAMTPHGWRASQARREAIIAAPINVTVAVRVDCFKQT